MRNSLKGKRVVVIGGGTGVFTVLSGLRSHSLNLAAIVSMADDGGSSGVLRDEFGILPPGDIRRAMVALSRHPNKILAQLFSYRFSEGKLAGHSFGNLILTALERSFGSFEKAVKEASKMLQVRGEVIPVTFDNTRLYAELENGAVICGETNIDIPRHDGKLKIKKIWLAPEAKINQNAKKAIAAADLIVMGPGDLYTSVIPNFLVTGMQEAIMESKAKKVYICNLMTKYGETHKFTALDFVRKLEESLKLKPDYIILNDKKPTKEMLAKYSEEEAEFVIPDTYGSNVIKADLLRGGTLIRHDPKKLAKVLISLL
ncbi:MAG: YvcK family protein [bacterium]|nr:YvcK family protein [bacterium]